MNHKLRVATWNVAAVNNNPFEYYVDHDDPAYFRMLRCVEELIDSPGDRDVMLGTLINDAMFADLCRELEIARFAHVDAARECWARDLKKRRCVLAELLRPYYHSTNLQILLLVMTLPDLQGCIRFSEGRRHRCQTALFYARSCHK
jgi:hypothetical protein